MVTIPVAPLHSLTSGKLSVTPLTVWVNVVAGAADAGAADSAATAAATPSASRLRMRILLLLSGVCADPTLPRVGEATPGPACRRALHLRQGLRVRSTERMEAPSSTTTRRGSRECAIALR